MAVASAGFGIIVTSDYMWLRGHLAPRILEQAVACWNGPAAKADVVASETRRDRDVIATALMGEELARQKAGTPRLQSVAITTFAASFGTADRMSYVYEAFWPAVTRRKLFDDVANRRPMCGSGGTVPIPRPVA